LLKVIFLAIGVLGVVMAIVLVGLLIRLIRHEDLDPERFRRSVAVYLAMISVSVAMTGVSGVALRQYVQRTQ
jgi:ABC-type transport system involved in cytochrome c biogenesis permease subunit